MPGHTYMAEKWSVQSLLYRSLIHTKKHTLSFRKLNLRILRAESFTKTHYCFGSHFWFSGDTPFDLYRERLQAPWRALAFREKALNSTLSACIVEHASGCMIKKMVTSRITLGVSTYTHCKCFEETAQIKILPELYHISRKSNFASCLLSVHVWPDLDLNCLTHWWYSRKNFSKGLLQTTNKLKNFPSRQSVQSQYNIFLYIFKGNNPYLFPFEREELWD